MYSRLKAGIGSVVHLGKHKNKDGDAEADGTSTGNKRTSINRYSLESPSSGAHSPHNCDQYGKIPKPKIYSDMCTQTDCSSMKNPSAALQKRLKTVACSLVGLSIVYCVIIICILMSSTLQSLLLYANLVNVPYVADLTDLSIVNLHSARNIKCQTEDGVILRGYHVIPTQVFTQMQTELSYHDSKNATQATDELFTSYLTQSRSGGNSQLCKEDSDRTCHLQQQKHQHPIILYLHGNAGNRAMADRVYTVQQLADMFNAHVITFDYRGFGDNIHPYRITSDKFTHLDALAMMQWIVQQFHGTVPVDVYVYGHSLGAAIGIDLVHTLEASHESRVHVQGLILDSPFTSVPEVAVESPTAGHFPLFRSLGFLMNKCVRFKYPNIELLPHIKANLLFMHATADDVIPVSHTHRLFAAVCPATASITQQTRNDSAATGHQHVATVYNCLIKEKHENDSRVMTKVVIEGGHHDLLYQQASWYPVIRDFLTATAAAASVGVSSK